MQQPAQPAVPTVLALDDQLQVALDEPQLEAVQTVEVRMIDATGAPGAVVARAGRGTGLATLDVSNLKPGEPYEAVLLPERPALMEPLRFTLATPAERREAQVQMQRFAQLKAGSYATALMCAAWLDAGGWSYDARAMLRSARPQGD